MRIFLGSRSTGYSGSHNETRRAGSPTRPSLLADADRWFDSGRVAHNDRGHLDLPPLAQIIAYTGTVLESVRAKLAAVTDSDEALYYFRLALFHEDMHAEALTYMRQTLDYPAHAPLAMSPVERSSGSCGIAIENRTFLIGGSRDEGQHMLSPAAPS